MNPGKFLAFVSMGLAVGASIGYLYVGDYRKAIYWAAAAIITATVTL